MTVSFLFKRTHFILISLECGYLTGYSGDGTSIGPWQYRLMGFSNPPTDFYTRPFFMLARGKLNRDKCLASRTISKVQFDYIQQVFDTFKNQLKFFFSFNGKIIFFILIVYLPYSVYLHILYIHCIFSIFHICLYKDPLGSLNNINLIACLQYIGD